MTDRIIRIEIVIPEREWLEWSEGEASDEETLTTIIDECGLLDLLDWGPQTITVHPAPQEPKP